MNRAGRCKRTLTLILSLTGRGEEIPVTLRKALILEKVLLDYFWYFEVVAIARRRIREYRVGVRPVGHFVIAHGSAGLTDLRRWGDIFGVEFVQFVHVRKHFVHVGAQTSFVLRRQLQAREKRDVADLFESYF